jgi:predicted nucleotidyltransferase
MLVRVDPNASVAGYPVLLVRQALRKLRHIDIWNSGLLEAAAGLRAGAGRELAKALADRGLIRKLQKDTWTITTAGMTFTAATAAKRLKRATAERALAAFLERVARVNTDPYFLGRVTRVALFGSMLSPDTGRPSDIDVAVEIVPKIADWDSHIAKNNDRAQELIMLGHRFRHSIEYAVCWQLEVFRFLKGRSRAISLADYTVEKRLVLAAPHRMLLGDDEPAPPSSEDSRVPHLRRRSRDCPF